MPTHEVDQLVAQGLVLDQPLAERLALLCPGDRFGHGGARHRERRGDAAQTLDVELPGQPGKAAVLRADQPVERHAHVAELQRANARVVPAQARYRASLDARAGGVDEQQ